MIMMIVMMKLMMTMPMVIMTPIMTISFDSDIVPIPCTNSQHHGVVGQHFTSLETLSLMHCIGLKVALLILHCIALVIADTQLAFHYIIALRGLH